MKQKKFHEVFDPVSISNYNDLSRRIKQHLYINLMKRKKFIKYLIQCPFQTKTIYLLELTTFVHQTDETKEIS